MKLHVPLAPLTLALLACNGGDGGGAARLGAVDDNADLADLVLSAGELDPSFQSERLSYRSAVGFLAAGVRVTPTAVNQAATLTVDGAAVASGTPSQILPLVEGANAITIVVTATDGVTRKTYALDVARQSAASFARQAYLKASNTEPGDYFGATVALDGDTLAVGAQREDSSDDEDDNSATDSGAVYVFTREQEIWSQQAYIKASNTEPFDRFGEALAVDGDTLVVGAGGEDGGDTGIDGDERSNAATDSGAVYVFIRERGVWSQQAYIKASNTDPFDQFGSALALDGDTLVVGAYGEDSDAGGIGGDEFSDAATDSGAVYVFIRQQDIWWQQAYIKAFNGDPFDRFGSALALDGDTLTVGAFAEDSDAAGVDGDGENDAASDSGAGYVFQ